MIDGRDLSDRLALWLGFWIAAWLIAASCAVALAHSWYPFECCSERDCFPVAEQDVKTTPNGYVLSDGTVIAYGEARPSPDGQFHICRFQNGKGALIRQNNKPACFWAPVRGS